MLNIGEKEKQETRVEARSYQHDLRHVQEPASNPFSDILHKGHVSVASSAEDNPVVIDVERAEFENDHVRLRLDRMAAASST